MSARQALTLIRQGLRREGTRPEAIRLLELVLADPALSEADWQQAQRMIYGRPVARR